MFRASSGRSQRGARRGRGGRRFGGSHGNRRQNASFRSRPKAPRRAISQNTENGLDLAAEPQNVALDSFQGNFTQLFTQAVSFDLHLQAQDSMKLRYAATLEVLKQEHVEILQGCKVKALAAAWTRHDHELANQLLSDSGFIGVAEVLKAIQLLDAGRCQRFHEKKSALQKQQLLTAVSQIGKSRVGRRLAQNKIKINNLAKLKPSRGSVSGALARHIKRWTRKFTASELEFFALHMPPDAWKQLADVCHLNPDKDFPAAPWFLPYCFDPKGAKIPPDSLIKRCEGLNAENVNDFVAKVEIPFAHLKQFAGRLTPLSKARIASYTKDLGVVLWNYEALDCPEVHAVILTRLWNEKADLPYGKLVERLLYIRKSCKIREQSLYSYSKRSRHANGVDLLPPFYRYLLEQTQDRLKDVKVNLIKRAITFFGISLETPIAVLGDASGSMSVAIETATIIGSFLRAATNATLLFFNEVCITPPFLPKTVAEVIDLALQMRAEDCTCPAAALWPFYEKRQVVKTFILTTDEIETDRLKKGERRYNFLDLFTKYHRKVYPARLVFISFLPSQHDKGKMVEPLRAAGFDVLQFKFDSQRPDLTKLDNVFGQLAVGSGDSFEEKVSQLEAKLKDAAGKSIDNSMSIEEAPQPTEAEGAEKIEMVVEVPALGFSAPVQVDRKLAAKFNAKILANGGYQMMASIRSSAAAGKTDE